MIARGRRWLKSARMRALERAASGLERAAWALRRSVEDPRARWAEGAPRPARQYPVDAQSSSAVSSFALADVTYELFGIVPADFYRTRFALGPGIPDVLANPVGWYDLGYEKVRRLIADLQAALPQGGRALDVGCGSGPHGPTLRAHVPGLRLFGVDFSEECARQARENGYEDCVAADFTDGLPYRDGFFDFVFSMDVLGHVEFRQKDALVDELARVTRPGGAGHHGAETGWVDYASCRPLDPDDPVRKYVLTDGHIGTEPVRALVERFRRRFSEVQPRITYLYPFLEYGAFSREFESAFGELLALHRHPETIQAVNVVLGRLNRHFVELYGVVFGDRFVAADEPGDDRSDPVRRLFQPAGFTSLSVMR